MKRFADFNDGQMAMRPAITVFPSLATGKLAPLFPLAISVPFQRFHKPPKEFGLVKIAGEDYRASLAHRYNSRRDLRHTIYLFAFLSNLKK